MDFQINGRHYQVRDSDELVQVCRITGSHFFDRDNIKAFRSRLEPRIFETSEGIYFVTTERFVAMFSDRKEPRKWTIRLFNLDGEIKTVRIENENGFQKFGSLVRAYKYIEKNLL